MNSELIVGIIATVVVLVLALLVMFGLGDFLISGYNTASEEKKARYNLPRLRVVTSLAVIAITASVWVCMLLKTSEIVIVAVTLVWVVIMFILDKFYVKK
ncbi:MAG: DUF3784 domain-containing protein [Alistipes sp.]|nr:DUF3784 domain-containing protein [Alistipes sp.]